MLCGSVPESALLGMIAMAKTKPDPKTAKVPSVGGRMLTEDEIAELRRSGRVAIEYCRQYFRENPL